MRIPDDARIGLRMAVQGAVEQLTHMLKGAPTEVKHGIEVSLQKVQAAKAWLDVQEAEMSRLDRRHGISRVLDKAARIAARTHATT